MHVVGDLLKRRIAPLQRRPRLCCWFTGPNDIGRIQRGPGTDLSWDELAVLVGGITGETFVPESLILPQNIPALCDDPSLRMAILATLLTLDDNGVAVRRVLLVGGGARSDALRRIAPQVLGLPVSVPAPGEYVADGAARQAAWVLSGSAEPPTWTATSEAETFEGDPTPYVRERYAQVRELTATRP